MKIHNNAVARDALRVYKNLVTSLMNDSESFLVEEQLLINHECFQKEALDYFRGHRMDDGAQSNSDELKQVFLATILLIWN